MQRLFGARPARALVFVVAPAAILIALPAAASAAPAAAPAKAGTPRPATEPWLDGGSATATTTARVAASAVPATRTVGGLRITATDLGSLGGEQTWPQALNATGQVTGYGLTADGANHAFLWSNGRLTDLGVLGRDGIESIGIDVNDRGQVVGYGTTYGGVGYGFSWQRGRMTRIPTLGGDYIDVRAVNNLGQVIGTSTTAAGVEHGFLWQGGRLTDLGEVSPTQVNNAGVVVGGYQTPTGWHLFRWYRGTLTDLGDLGGSSPQAAAVNDRGEIAAYADRPTGGSSAYLYRRDAWTPLPSAGGDEAYATDVNERGDVVGPANRTAGGPWHAVRWRAGVPTDLGTLTPDGVANASDVNNLGHAVGYAGTPAGVNNAVLWRDGRVIDLGTPDVESGARAGNDRGQIIGAIGTSDAAVTAVLWTVTRT